MNARWRERLVIQTRKYLAAESMCRGNTVFSRTTSDSDTTLNPDNGAFWSFPTRITARKPGVVDQIVSRLGFEGRRVESRMPTPGLPSWKS